MVIISGVPIFRIFTVVVLYLIGYEIENPVHVFEGENLYYSQITHK